MKRYRFVIEFVDGTSSKTIDASKMRMYNDVFITFVDEYDEGKFSPVYNVKTALVKAIEQTKI